MEATNVHSVLDRLLSEGRGLARQVEDAAAAQLGVSNDPGSRARLRHAGLAGGAAVGVLALLMGSRRRGTFSRSALLAGGVGALAKVAFDAWQRQGNGAPSQRPIDALTDEAEGEARARTLLYALVAAAKADGHVDEEEQSAIEAEMEGLPGDIRSLMREAMASTPTPEAIAARVTGGQEAREVYAASALLCGRETPTEAAYLDRLSRALSLSEGDARSIEAGLHAV